MRTTAYVNRRILILSRLVNSELEGFSISLEAFSPGSGDVEITALKQFK